MRAVFNTTPNNPQPTGRGCPAIMSEPAVGAVIQEVGQLGVVALLLFPFPGIATVVV